MKSNIENFQKLIRVLDAKLFRELGGAPIRGMHRSSNNLYKMRIVKDRQRSSSCASF
jgi:hypothetical protein